MSPKSRLSTGSGDQLELDVYIVDSAGGSDDDHDLRDVEKITPPEITGKLTLEVCCPKLDLRRFSKPVKSKN